jgi:UDP-N-acetyl-alpha-D-muramoyl-L-alanyl-L-glutamate epimerase
MKNQTNLHKPNISKLFVYQKYEILLSQNKILFWYLVDNKYQFCHTIELDLSFVKDIPEIQNAVFNLGLAEIPSYFKAFCSSQIIVQAGFLNSEQIKFWQELYTKGLGEFFYRNQIDFRNLIQIKVDFNSSKKQNLSEIQNNLSTSFPQVINNKLEEISLNNLGFGSKIKLQKFPKKLVPLGGGKDSLVTGEILKSQDLDFCWFMLEPYSWIKKQIKLSQNPKVIFAYRSIEKNFGQLKKLSQNTKLKLYNGHIPISAVYAFSSALIAQIYGFEEILISQEKSSNIGNITFLGEQINHQYSKSQEFEENCRQYILDFINPKTNYRSFLRNLYEIEIAKIFSQKCKVYFDLEVNFYSCNKGLKDGFWCGKCAKCAFTYSILSPFLEKNILEKIWQKDLFEDKNLLSLFQDLIGKGKLKPWDCVGVFEETETALFLTKQKILKQNLKMPYILDNLDLNLHKEYQKLI